MNRSSITFALLGYKLGFNMYEMIRFVNENQYWSKDQIQDYQIHELRKLVEHSYHHTRYYKRTMDERGISPSSIQSLEDLKRFPIIGKQEINQCHEDFIADNCV